MFFFLLFALDGFNNQQGVSPAGSFEMVDGENVSAQNNHSEYGRYLAKFLYTVFIHMQTNYP